VADSTAAAVGATVGGSAEGLYSAEMPCSQASITVRIVNREGTVIWAHSQDSPGGLQALGERALQGDAASTTLNAGGLAKVCLARPLIPELTLIQAVSGLSAPIPAPTHPSSGRIAAQLPYPRHHSDGCSSSV
jgi:hypothetical protein